MAVLLRSLVQRVPVATNSFRVADARSISSAVMNTRFNATTSGSNNKLAQDVRKPEEGRSFLSVWSSDSTTTLVERKVAEPRTVLELKRILEQDIVVADAHGKIIPTGVDLPATSKDEPITVFPVAELDRFLARRSLPIGWSGLRTLLTPGLGPSPEQILIWICMGDRVVKSENHFPARPFSALFADFCSSSPERAAWQQPGAAVLFWTSPTFPPQLAMDSFMIRSVQRSSNCYLHAPVMLQHYNVVKGSGRADHNKVDIAKYVQNNISGDALRRYLQGKGGCSLDILVSLARLSYSDTFLFAVSGNPAYHPGHAAMIENQLRDNGPALISMFPVDSRFLTATTATATFRKADFDLQRVVGRHAMVLLGIRPDAQEGHMCLVQNWRAGTELLEMSLPYLAATGCLITFVAKRLTAIPADLPQISAAFTEAMSDAAGEYAPREQ